MRQEQAKRLVIVITAMNWMLVIIASTIMIKCIIEWIMPGPKKEEEKRGIYSVKEKKGKETKKLEMYKACWEIEIIEKGIVKEKKVEKEIELIKEIPFELISVMVTTNNKGNYAVIKEKRSEKQILVKEKEIVKGYKIEAIEKEQIKMSLKGKKGIIEIKKDWLKLEKEEKK